MEIAFAWPFVAAVTVRTQCPDRLPRPRVSAGGSRGETVGEPAQEPRPSIRSSARRHRSRCFPNLTTVATALARIWEMTRRAAAKPAPKTLQSFARRRIPPWHASCFSAHDRPSRQAGRISRCQRTRGSRRWTVPSSISRTATPTCTSARPASSTSARCAAPSGGIDIERVRAYVESRLHLIPRYRQHIARIPFEGHPVWVDDDQFDIRYHVRHLSLPRPGCERELKRLAGWINSQQLDRGKPLWEMWVVEGLEDDRFALIAKTHHCMIDGLAGADLLAVLLRPSDDTDIDEAHRWRPRPAPTPGRLLRDAVLRRLTMPLRARRAHWPGSRPASGRAPPTSRPRSTRSTSLSAAAGLGDAAQPPDRQPPPLRLAAASTSTASRPSRTASAAPSTTSCWRWSPAASAAT